MHMTRQSIFYLISEPQFAYMNKKNLDSQKTNNNSSKTLLLVQYEIPDDDIYGEGKQCKQITQTFKNQIRQMINNLPKLGEQQRIPYQDVVFKNLQKIFNDQRQSLPGSYIKALKQPKERHSSKQRHRVSISIPLQNSKPFFDVQQQTYHNSDKNFQYDMKIAIKKIPNHPPQKDHPLKKYLTGRLAQYQL